MNQVKRSLADKLINVPWLLLFIWYGWSSLKSGNGNINFNPVSNIPFGMTLVLVGLVAAQILWEYNNPYAVVKKDILIISPTPFQKEIIKIENIIKVRESLTQGKHKIFNFNFGYTKWVLMIDLSNSISMTRTIPLDHKKRKRILTLLSDNNILVESV